MEICTNVRGTRMKFNQFRKIQFRIQMIPNSNKNQKKTNKAKPNPNKTTHTHVIYILQAIVWNARPLRTLIGDGWKSTPLNHSTNDGSFRPRPFSFFSSRASVCVCFFSADKVWSVILILRGLVSDCAFRERCVFEGRRSLRAVLIEVNFFWGKVLFRRNVDMLFVKIRYEELFVDF